ANKKWLETQNEAGYFLRNYQKNWSYYQKNPFLYIEDEQSEPKIHIVGTAKNVGQAKFVGELLSKRNHSEKTAWVLADENVLPIALQSIPENIEQLNITMGYPLKEVPLSHLFYAIFKLHLGTATNFYYKNVLAVLHHPYLSKIAPNSLFLNSIWRIMVFRFYLCFRRVKMEMNYLKYVWKLQVSCSKKQKVSNENLPIDLSRFSINYSF
ncbi:MAG: hypothetical protein CSA94_01595, partial [Bacteroidetes bacterium]